MINLHVTHNFEDIIGWLDNFKIRRRKVKAWARTVQRHEREQAQRAIKNRGRGDFRWQTPLYRTGLLYSRVNYSFRLRALSKNYTLTVETPVHYASYLADRWPYLNMTEKDITIHTNALAALVFDNQKTNIRGLLTG